MKKFLKIMLIIFAVLIIVMCSVYISTRIIYSANIKEYNNRQTIRKEIESESLNNDFNENNYIELDDLTISLENLKYYPDGNDDYQASSIVGADNKNLLLTTINFSNKENLSVNIKSLQYLIFDENNNIIAENYQSKNGLNYMKGFIYEKYSEKSLSKALKHVIAVGRAQNNITEDISIVSTTFATNVNYIPKQLTIRLFDLQYSIDGKKSKSLGLDDFEFVININ